MALISTTIIDTYGDGNTLTIDATEFAAFYYDIDDNVTTESLSIKDVAGTAGNVIGEGGLVYSDHHSESCIHV